MTTEPSNLSDALRALPDLEPPPGSWRRVLSRYNSQRRRRTAIRSLSLLATAACIALVAVVAGVDRPAPIPQSSPSFAATPEVSLPVDVERLQRQSQQLEQILASLPPRPAIVRADTAVVIGTLQDDIALIDDRLNYAGPQSGDAPRLWQRRVDRLDRLMRVRFAEADASAF